MAAPTAPMLYPLSWTLLVLAKRKIRNETTTPSDKVVGDNLDHETLFF